MISDDTWGDKYSLCNYGYKLNKFSENAKESEDRGDYFLKRYRKEKEENVLAAGLKNFLDAFKNYICAEDPENAMRVAREKLRMEREVYENLERIAKTNTPIGEDSKTFETLMTYIEEMSTEDLVFQFVCGEGLE